MGQYLHRLRRGRIGQAIVLTALGYAVMTLYDMFALTAIGKRLPRRRVALISFISYAFSNTLGMALLVSGSIRYRFYIQAGLSTADVAKVVLFCTVSFWLGLCAVTGATLLLEPVSPQLPFAALHIPLGIVLTLLPLAWLLGGLLRREPLRFRRWQLALPSFGTALRQVLVGALDWGLAAAVLYALMPSEIVIDFGPFLAIFVLAQMAGLVSHVPGGLGVFEAVMLAGLGATGNATLSAPMLGALAAFRGVYYLLPLCVATVLVVVREARGLRQRTLLSPWFTGLLPPFFAGLTLVSGAILLFSGATQALPRRLTALSHVLPLPVLEVSHFLSSVIGMSLLILARGLQRRLDAAYVLTLTLLVAGAVFSLLKGIDYEEATLLIMLALALAPAHLAIGVPRESSPSAKLYVYAASVLVATVIQVLLPLPWLRGLERGEERLRVVLDWRDPAVQRVFKLMVPVALGVGLINVNALIDTFFASRLIDPSLSPAAIQYAFLIYMFPQGMFSVAIATVLFPTLSRLAARGEMGGFRETVSSGIRQIAFMLVPMAVVSAVLCEPIVRILYQHGNRWHSSQTVTVAACLAAFSAGLVFNGWMLMLNRAFFSLQDNWTPIVGVHADPADLHHPARRGDEVAQVELGLGVE